MAVPNPEPVPPDRSGRPWNVASVTLVILAGLLALPGRRPPGQDTAYFIGEITGSLIAPALFAALIYAAVRRFNRHKPRSRSAKILFWILFGWFALVLVTFVGRAIKPRANSRQAVITDKERRGLDVGRDSIKHGALGFALPNPDGHFVRDTALESRVRTGARITSEMAAWVFQDTTHGQVLLVQVIKLPALNEASFRAFARGMRGGIGKSTVLMDSVTWTASDRSYRLALRSTAGAYVLMRCLPQLKQHAELVVCVQITAADSVGVAAVPDALTIAR